MTFDNAPDTSAFVNAKPGDGISVSPKLPVIRLGIVGLDTSHAPAFTELLYDAHHPYHVPGAKVVAAYPGGSQDFELSRTRVGPYTNQLRNDYDVEIVASIAHLPNLCDAFLLESVDGRVHLDQFKQLVPYGKPIFVDKPFALSSRDAAEMLELARGYHTPVMSCSALRFSEALVSELERADDGDVIGCDASGPMELEPTQPGLFWYGIHSVEVLFTTLGPRCVSVQAVTNEFYDHVVGLWEDGRIGTIRGNRRGNRQFAAVIHREKSSHSVDISACQKPFYASLLERIVEMCQTRVPACDIADAAQIVRFIECANESRKTGKVVQLA